MKVFGVGRGVWQLIVAACRSPKIKRLILYGSRARGDYKQSSDIDIAIDAPTMSSKEFASLWNALDDLPIIYSLDVVHLQALHNQVLLEAIDKDGKTLLGDGQIGHF